MKQKYNIYTEVLISSPLERVWHAICRIEDYGNWNEFVTHIQGDVKLGSQLHINIKPFRKKRQKYVVRIVEIEPKKSLSWLGEFFIPGLLDGHHQFRLESIGEEKTKLIHQEQFKGILVPVLWPFFIVPYLKPQFDHFNLSLKSYLEKETA